ncbi:hypothetical protein FA13DRAFT_977791 [Coprinellus micaceus]|uniref:Uncharacterized protein n=1 Tax=Coprinellus micaceus TaxID=71717 RepID=A0A4Y7SZ19_COPMI|nr:hypothetical protein FA13DRAFT_977791 [Coprinellus micaceus]
MSMSVWRFQRRGEELSRGAIDHLPVLSRHNDPAITQNQAPLPLQRLPLPRHLGLLPLLLLLRLHDIRRLDPPLQNRHHLQIPVVIIRLKRVLTLLIRIALRIHIHLIPLRINHTLQLSRRPPHIHRAPHAHTAHLPPLVPALTPLEALHTRDPQQIDVALAAREDGAPGGGGTAGGAQGRGRAVGEDDGDGVRGGGGGEDDLRGRAEAVCGALIAKGPGRGEARGF